MNWVSEYKQKLVKPEEAVKVVQPGDWVDYGSFSGSVVVLDRALAARKDELWDVKIRNINRVAGVPEVSKVDPAGEHFIYNSWQLSSCERRLSDQGLCSYIPVIYHEMPEYYRNYVDLDVLMLATMRDRLTI